MQRTLLFFTRRAATLCFPLALIVYDFSAGLATLIAGNLLWPQVWLWSVLGTNLYAFGIGLIFPTLFRFTLFTNPLPKGTVSAG